MRSYRAIQSASPQKKRVKSTCRLRQSSTHISRPYRSFIKDPKCSYCNYLKRQKIENNPETQVKEEFEPQKKYNAQLVVESIPLKNTKQMSLTPYRRQNNYSLQGKPIYNNINNEPLNRQVGTANKKIRNEKSRIIKEQQENLDRKFKKTFDYLLSQNQAYLSSKQKVCCQRSKPFIGKFNFHNLSGNTIYKVDYIKHPLLGTSDKTKIGQFQRTTAPKLPNQTMSLSSTTQLFHDKKEPSKTNLCEPKNTNKFEGPMRDYTTYQNHYPFFGNSQRNIYPNFTDVVIKDFPLSQNGTNYQKFYKGQPGKKSQIATFSKQVNLIRQHPFCGKFIAPSTTDYRQNYYHKNYFKNNINWKKSENFQKPFGITPFTYNTQYIDEYFDKNGQPTNLLNKCQYKLLLKKQNVK